MEWLKVANGINGSVSVQCEVLCILREPIIIIVGLGLVIILSVTQCEQDH